eukprot:4752380-Prymnesium_polylepis.1
MFRHAKRYSVRLARRLECVAQAGGLRVPHCRDTRTAVCENAGAGSDGRRLPRGSRTVQGSAPSAACALGGGRRAVCAQQRVCAGARVAAPVCVSVASPAAPGVMGAGSSALRTKTCI